MAHNFWQNKAFLGSAALNIFLIAFTLGHHVGPRSVWPPSGAPLHLPGTPFMGPEDLFGPQEMRANMESLQSSLEQVRKLRHDFAERLKSGSVTQAEVTAHFAAVNAIMERVKAQLQAKAARKIAGMTEAERQSFARRMLDNIPPGPAFHDRAGSDGAPGHSAAPAGTDPEGQPSPLPSDDGTGPAAPADGGAPPDQPPGPSH